MEKLIVQNFGPIKSAEIELKKFNILIGHTSTGKSAIAKLFSLINSSHFLAIKDGDFNSFKKQLERFNIDFSFKKNTKIIFKRDKNTWEITEHKLKTDWKDTNLFSWAKESESDKHFAARVIDSITNDDELKKLMKEVYSSSNGLATTLKNNLLSNIANLFDPIYIPAERILISSITDSIFDFIRSDINLPECILEFGRLYQRAKQGESLLEIPFMNSSVKFSKDGDKLILKSEKDNELPLKLSSSGFQSIIPLLSVFSYYIKSVERDKLFVIEEPELNLFPTAQTDLIEYIVSNINRSPKNDSIILTTHSPYVLSVLDNLVLADSIGNKKGNKKKTNEIISQQAWININDISSYFFDIDGNVKAIIDKEYCSIGAEYIDEASNKTGEIFSKLSELR